MRAIAILLAAILSLLAYTPGLHCQQCNIGTVSWYLSYPANDGNLGHLSTITPYGFGPGNVPVCEESYGLRANLNILDSTIYYRTIEPLSPVTRTLHCYSDLLGRLYRDDIPMLMLGDTHGATSYISNTSVFVSSGFVASLVSPSPIQFIPNEVVRGNETVYITDSSGFYYNFLAIRLRVPSYNLTNATYEIKIAPGICTGSVFLVLSSCLQNATCAARYYTNTSAVTTAAPTTTTPTTSPPTTLTPTTVTPTTRTPTTTTVPTTRAATTAAAVQPSTVAPTTSPAVVYVVNNYDSGSDAGPVSLLGWIFIVIAGMIVGCACVGAYSKFFDAKATTNNAEVSQPLTQPGYY